MPARPVLDTRADADAIKNMRAIVPYVFYFIREKLNSDPVLGPQFADVEVHVHQPLEILRESGLAKESPRSFKPPWTAVQAVDALTTAGMHEAGANALWCNAHPPVEGSAQGDRRRASYVV